MLLPERPYLPPGTLRQVLVRPDAEIPVPDESVYAVLRALGIETVLARSGGLDAERDWDDLLSLSEHQLLSVARLALARPRFAVLHRIGTTLEGGAVARAVGMLCEAGIGVLELGDASGAIEDYDAVIEVDAKGAWAWRRAFREHAAG
jgi:putative ATP-binding cassette transporter